MKMALAPDVSPVTGKPGVVVRSTISVDVINTLYKNELGLDVLDSFNGLESISIVECTQTGYRFYYPYNIAGNDRFYEKLQKIMDQSVMYYRPWGYDHEMALPLIQTGQKVLDIGCGSGNFLRRAKAQTNEVYGLEFNNAAIEKCRKEGLTVYADPIEEHAAKRPGFYDVVTIFQVLEHIYDIHSFLDAALRVLKPGGRLIIGVPNNEPYHMAFHKYATLNLPPHHMGLWSLKAFKALEGVFNVKVTKMAYDVKGRWTLDAYYRAKFWLNIKSQTNEHTAMEKFKMALLAPVSVPISLFKRLTTGIHGGNIFGVFEKI